MKIGYLLSFIVFFVVIMGNHLIAADSGSSNVAVLPSVEWQKINLQEKITNKINKGLSAIIKSNQFIVDVDIVVAEPSAPNFSITSVPPKQVKFLNEKMQKTSQDYIVFSKLGLEAPVMSEFEPVKNEKSELYYLWKYNQSLDIFQNLEKISVEIYLSDRLTPETKKSVSDVIKSLKFNFGEIKPKLNISYINMDEKLTPDPTAKPANPLQKATAKQEVKPKLPVPPTAVEILSKFGNMIGLIVASLLLGIFGFVLFRKYEKLEAHKSGNNAQAPAAAQAHGNNTKDEKDEKHHGSSASGVTATAGGELLEQQYSGIDRFKNFLEKSPAEAGVLVKKWLKSEDDLAKKALVTLVQQLETKDLMKIFDLTSLEEREHWKELVASFGMITDLAPIKDYISKQIVEDVMVPSVIQDVEVCEALMAMKEADAAKFIIEHKEFSGLLMNVMSTKYISRVIELFTPEEADMALEYSLAFNKNEIETILPEFKTKLLIYQTKKAQNPFIKKIIELITMASPEREKSLIARLAILGEFETIKNVARDFFPSELVSSLSDSFVERIFRTMSLNEKTELLVSMKDEGLRDKFLSSFAPVGSSARDMMDLEFEKYKENPALLLKNAENADEIWKKFVSIVRSMARNEKGSGEEIDALIDVWVIELKTEAAKSSSLHVAETAPVTEAA